MVLYGLCVTFAALLLVSHGAPHSQDVFHMAVESQELKEKVNNHGLPTAANPVVLAFAKHFQDHMVLQRAPNQANVYGFSPDIGTKLVMAVKVIDTDATDYYETTVKRGPEPNQGVWRFLLKPMPTNTTVSIRVEGESGTLQLTDVIFGDVWVCSGQSNMEFTVSMMDKAAEELKDAHNYPLVRIFAASEEQSATPVHDFLGLLENWSKPDEKTLGGKEWTYFSAVCWLFGKNIHKAMNIPIGLIDTNWGGTPVEAWSSPDALAKCNVTSNEGKRTDYQRTEYMKDSDLKSGVGGPQSNSVLWNAMVEPLLGLTIYGTIWYQGEADMYHPMVDRYNCTFPAMIDDWRAKFHAASGGQTSDEFPFGFVQLSANNPDPSTAFGIPDIRWHQTADYGFVPNPRMSNVFMAVAMDLPGFSSRYGSIHPRDKTDVGYRLASSGLKYAYGQTESCDGPFPVLANVTGRRILIKYRNVEALEIRDWAGFDLLCTSQTSSVGIWVPTSIVANTSDTISLFLNVCDKGQEVRGLRYAWRESPCAFKKCAVYGADSGLPGPQFVAYAAKTLQGQVVFDFKGPTGV